MKLRQPKGLGVIPHSLVRCQTQIRTTFVRTRMRELQDHLPVVPLSANPRFEF
jgi:hypothetical protein